MTYAAGDWWESEKATLSPYTIRKMTWAIFQERLLEKYFSQAKKNKKEKEFIKIVQGNMTVREYTTQFKRLSRFASYMVHTAAKKNCKYQQGLNLSLCTISYISQSFEALVGLVVELKGLGNEN